MAPLPSWRSMIQRPNCVPIMITQHIPSARGFHNMTVKMERERSNSPETALLLIAHGSRHESANDDTRALAAELVRREACRVAVAAFLELAQPDIDGGAAECVRLGAR